jgi:co-chaperonin GroES (HSP10)
MATIKKDTLHPENESEVDIYPKTSIDQVENLQANLDALNGDIANVNGEIANISTNVENIANKVGDINKDVSTLKYNDTNQDRRIQVLENTSGTTINRVEIAENNISDIRDDITVLNTAYGSYTDYTKVTNGFLLTYLSGKQIELPIKAGTNVTFSKYPGTNQIVINATGGSVPDNIAILSADNVFTGNNQFVNIHSIGILEFYGGGKQYRFSRTTSGFKFFIISGDNINSLLFPNRTGTLALVEDLPKLADYPTTIFFNNYNAGIGYKDTSTGTTKTVVSTDNNGAQIVIGDSNTGLTLATNARPKVLEDSTVKEVAYVSDIPNTSSFPTLAGNNKWTGDNIFDGFSKSIRVNGLFQVSGDEELISATYNQVSYDGFNIAYMDGENQNIFHIGIDFENKARFGFDKYDGSSYNLYIPEKDGTIALLSDITSGSSQDFSLYSDYEIVDKGFMLTYADGSKFELPIKAGTNVTFSKYPGSNQIIINSTGGSVPDNIALLDADNNWSAVNKFYEYIQCNRGIKIYSNETNEGIVIDSYTITINGSIPTREDLKIEYVYQKGYALNTITKNGGSSTYNRLIIPIKNSTIATIDDIPISLMYSSSRLGVNSVDFPFNTDKNYFFTITMTNTGESKSFIYAKGTNATYTIVINSSTSFEVKLDATGSSTRLIFTNKSNADPFVVRAEISN